MENDMGKHTHAETGKKYGDIEMNKSRMDGYVYVGYIGNVYGIYKQHYVNNNSIMCNQSAKH